LNSFKYTSKRRPVKDGEPSPCVRLTALQTVKTLLDYLHSLLPPDSAVLPFGGIHASLNLLGSKSATDEGVEIGVSSGFAGAPVKLVVNPVGATNWTVSV
jgi:hypothetical protein